MIKANHTYTGKLVCDLFSGYKLDKAFYSVNMIGDCLNEYNLPVLMIANHFSWWDGFIQYRLNKQIFKRKFHVMMLEEQLSKHMILNKGGAFSIRKNSKEIINSLNYCIELLKDKNNLVLLFPQGKIESLYTSHFIFENGLGYLLKHLQNDIELVFNVNLIDYYSEKKPSLNIYYKLYSYPQPADLKQVENDFNHYANECKLNQSKCRHQ